MKKKKANLHLVDTDATKEDLLPFNAVIQNCPMCGKVDVYKNDWHDCGAYLQNQEAQEYYD
jgi:hypothetical protein